MHPKENSMTCGKLVDMDHMPNVLGMTMDALEMLDSRVLRGQLFVLLIQ